MSLALDKRSKSASHPVSLKRTSRLNRRLKFLAVPIVASAVLLSVPGVALAQPQPIADFNGDGVEDLAIGAPGARTVSIFIGVKGAGFQKSMPNWTVYGGTADRDFGGAVAAADLDDDDRSELIVGISGLGWRQRCAMACSGSVLLSYFAATKTPSPRVQHDRAWQSDCAGLRAGDDRIARSLFRETRQP